MMMMTMMIGNCEQSQVEERRPRAKRQAGEDRTEPASGQTQSRHGHPLHVACWRCCYVADIFSVDI